MYVFWRFDLCSSLCLTHSCKFYMVLREGGGAPTLNCEPPLTRKRQTNAKNSGQSSCSSEHHATRSRSGDAQSIRIRKWSVAIDRKADIVFGHWRWKAIRHPLHTHRQNNERTSSSVQAYYLIHKKSRKFQTSYKQNAHHSVHKMPATAIYLTLFNIGCTLTFS